MDRQRVISIDPYFDGGGPRAAAPTLPQPDPNAPPNYAGVQQDMLSQMRPGPAGLRGTIIPHATMGGVPMGVRPHNVANTEITIDPHIEGQSSRVRLGDLTPDVIAQASRMAENDTPEPVDMATLRARGAATMHRASQVTQRQQQAFQQAPAQMQPIVPQTPQYPQQYQQPQYQQPQAPVRHVSPLSAFNQPPLPPQRELRDINLNQTYGNQQSVEQPTVEVVFEIEHFGNLVTRYHDVIDEQGFIILVFDNRCQAATKYFPQTPKTEVHPNMALGVTGSPRVYQVETTGIQFTHDSLEFCVLSVIKMVEQPQQ